MRQTVLYIAMSLDGYIADRNGGVEWLTGQDGGADAGDSYTEFTKEIDTVVMGWDTYHQVTTELAPGEWVYEEFTSYIFTHRELDSTEKIRFVKESPGEFIRSLKRQDGKDIWICGGADIVQQLMREDVKDLFLSVEWLSGNYPERLKKALDHCETVITAWDGDRLAGLINAIDDSELTAYVHYLCVDPAYQKCGIGKELLRRIKEKYSTYLYLILLAENEPLIEYYKQNGFEYMDGRYVFMVRN